MINSGKYYLIKHLLLLTGLSDRTIRNYIKSGILIGEKTNGLWHFSQKQIELFLHNSSVRSAIKANNDAIDAIKDGDFEVPEFKKLSVAPVDRPSILCNHRYSSLRKKEYIGISILPYK